MAAAQCLSTAQLLREAAVVAAKMVAVVFATTAGNASTVTRSSPLPCTKVMAAEAKVPAAHLATLATIKGFPLASKVTVMLFCGGLLFCSI